jgi:hypothetical protein
MYDNANKMHCSDCCFSHVPLIVLVVPGIPRLVSDTTVDPIKQRAKRMEYLNTDEIDIMMQI